MPRWSKYFNDIRHNFLIKQANKNERIPNKLKFEAIMIDYRIIQAQEFMKDDEFISSDKLKSFLFKIKKNELSL